MAEQMDVDELAARPYQNELLEKAKKDNIIVYLGTGSGKTYIAIMLIRDMRPKLARGQKAIFLVNSVPLVDQQSKAISQMTGLSVGSYCGADGVDDWDEQKWRLETDKHQVLVLVHQVFLDLLTHSFFKLSNAALVVMDECHHAQSVKDHPYTRIMQDWYHQLKITGNSVPKILGLTACLMVKNVTVEKFHKEKKILEEVMDCKIETTEDLYEILKHVTCPKEEFVVYQDDTSSMEAENIVQICTKTTDLLTDIYIAEKKQIEDAEDNINYKATAKQDLEKHYKMMKNDILRCISSGVTNLGLIAVVLKYQNFKQMFYKSNNAAINAHYNFAIKSEMGTIMEDCFRKLDQIAQNIYYQRGDIGSLISLSSRKLLKLIDILRGNPECRSLVFVEEKFSAETVCSVLQEFSCCDPKLTHLKTDFAFSPGAKMNPKDAEQRKIINEERKKLSTTLLNFRSGITNTLVSTSVLEEGLDVRQCNMVIKFDFPSTFRSYVQSKGRARAKPSQYILLISENEDGKKRTKYKQYLDMEELSLKECHLRPIENNNNDRFQGLEFDPPFMADPDDPESARITGSQAKRLVHKYIDRIKVDRFTRLTPVWETTYVQGLGTSSGTGYQTKCYMPHKTPFTAPVKGEVRPGKKASVQSTSLVICQMLHYFEELDGRLKVKKRKYIHDDDDEDGRDNYNPNNRKTGTRKKKVFYEKEYPNILRLESKMTPTLYLHEVQYKLIKENSSYKYRHHRPKEDFCGIGFVTSSNLPVFDPLDLYPPAGHYQAEVIGNKQVRIDFERLTQIKNFHYYVLNSVWKVGTNMTDHGGDLLVVPLKDNEIDFDLLKLFSDDTAQRIKRIHFELSCKLDSVIFPSYKEKKENYFVEEFVPSSILTLNSKMPDMKISFKDYYKQTYGITIKDSNQALIRPSSADKKSYMLTSKSLEMGKKSKKDVYNTTLFVPELMEIEPISAGMWKQLQMLPFVLHRITSLISCRIFLEKLNYQNSSPSFSPHSDIESNQDLFGSLLRMEKKSKVNVAVGDILHAVTLKGANDEFDMERREILGDCFLKYYTGVFLYYKLLENDVINTEEGDLTSKRSRIVGNKNLCKIAQNLNLYQCMVNSSMEVDGTWLPPGINRRQLEQKLIELDKQFSSYIEEDKRRTLTVGSLFSWITEDDLDDVLDKPEEVLQTAAARLKENEDCCGLKMKSHKLINDKSMADCIEALIGTFMISSGQFGALEFMSKIGLNMSASNSVQALMERETGDGEIMLFQPSQDAFCDEHTRLSDGDRARVLYEKLGVEDIEKKIGYRFKEKSFLLQAFTHASYGDNRLTGSYERLEYIGDAVLDYLVTVYIYTQAGDNVGPGRITDIRSALVCNNMFASLLVDLGLHTFILLQSPELLQMIRAYVEDRRASSEIDNNLKLINEVEPPEIKYVEVPKVLGDVFESLIGAIYIDSGHNLETVWNVFERVFKHLDKVMRDPPKNAKKELLEKYPGQGEVNIATEPPSAFEENVKAVVTVVKNNKSQTFKGLGRNKVSAELAACKLALRGIMK